MKVAWSDGDTLSSRSMLPKNIETINSSLQMKVTEPSSTFEVHFPVGGFTENAVFSYACAKYADCVPPDGWSVTKTLSVHLLKFEFISKQAPSDEIFITFEKLISDTGEGFSVALILFENKKLRLPIFKKLVKMDISFGGDHDGQYLSKIKISWRAENMPLNAKLYLVPASTISGEIKLDSYEGEMYFWHLCDTVYMLIARSEDEKETFRVLEHRVRMSRGFGGENG